MSMDPDFTARYLNEPDAEVEHSPGRGIDPEPDLAAGPQAPAVPSIPEPTAPPTHRGT